MTEEPVILNLAQAEAVVAQFQETAKCRGWQLLAVAVIPNHVHILVGVPGDPDPERLLADFKAWGTRKLNAGWGPRKQWWVQSGSRRKKETPSQIRAAAEYVRDQPGSLLVWLDPRVAMRLNDLANGTA